MGRHQAVIGLYSQQQTEAKLDTLLSTCLDNAICLQLGNINNLVGLQPQSHGPLMLTGERDAVLAARQCIQGFLGQDGNALKRQLLG